MPLYGKSEPAFLCRKKLNSCQCRCVPHDPHSNRHFEDNPPSSRCPWNSPFATTYQIERNWQPVVGSFRYRCCYFCRPLSLVRYGKSKFKFERQEIDVLQYNYLSEVITEPPRHPLFWWLLRLAFIGFCASIVSDSISNSLRVVKTYRQVNDTKVSYGKATYITSRSQSQELTSSCFSRSCTRCGHSRRGYRPPWTWTQDSHFGQRPTGHSVLYSLEIIPRSVSNP